MIKTINGGFIRDEEPGAITYLYVNGKFEVINHPFTCPFDGFFFPSAMSMAITSITGFTIVTGNLIQELKNHLGLGIKLYIGENPNSLGSNLHFQQFYQEKDRSIFYGKTSPSLEVEELDSIKKVTPIAYINPFQTLRLEFTESEVCKNNKFSKEIISVTINGLIRRPLL